MFAPSKSSCIWTITPCHGRADLTERLLDSLEKAKASAVDRADVQSCLVDSTPAGSADAQRIEAACRLHRTVYLRGPESVRTKRNQGAEYAIQHGADILFFTDSDCEVSPQVLLEHLGAYALAASPFTQRPIGGAIGVTEFVGTETRAYRAAARTPFLDSFRFAEKMPEAPFAPCTNFSMLASLFDQLHGFEEGWQCRLGGDDTELGRRINNAGYAIVSRPQARVFHSTSTWSKWGAVIERAWRWGRMDIAVRVAEPREHLQWIAPMPLQTVLLVLPVAVIGGWVSTACLVSAGLLLAPALTAAARAGGRREWTAMLGAELLLSVFHAGAISESIRRGKPWWSYREIIGHPMQVGTSWGSRRLAAWASVWLLVAWIILWQGLAWLLAR